MLHHFNRTASNRQPEFIGASSASSNSGAVVTVTAISNVQAGDLLIAFGCNTNSSGTFEAGDGFCQTILTSAGNFSSIFTKVATGSESSYVFTPSGGTSVIIVLAYRNCELCQLQIGATTTGTSATRTGASITTDNQGTLLFFSYVEANTATITTAPAGMTQRQFAQSTAINAAVYELANVSQGTVTGAKTIVYSASGTGNGVLVQIKTAQRQVITPKYIAEANAVTSGTTTSIVINKPTETIENDLIVAIIASTSSGTSAYTSTGFTERYRNNGFAVLTKVAGASEGNSYTFTYTSTTAIQRGVIAIFRYCSYDAVGTNVTANPGYPSVTTASKYQLCITTSRVTANATWNGPNGMSTIYSSGTNPSLIISYSVPVRNGTFAGTAATSAGGTPQSISLALKGLVSS